MLIRPGNKLGEVVIRTKFGVVAADNRNFSKPIEDLMRDEKWKENVGLQGGPFCYIKSEIDVPF